MNQTDTIFAQATPPGRSGVAVIRLSGPQAQRALPHFNFTQNPVARYAHYHAFRCRNELIDQGLVLFFPAPHSFTGEDVIEFQLHGGVAILRRMMDELGVLPSLRLAQPGEFSQRAFLNGKFDLTAAEGLVDLIDAETELQRQQATRLMQGYAAAFYDKLRDDILKPLAFLEAYIDFPDEEIPASAQAEIDTKINELSANIAQQLQAESAGERIREGFCVVLLGSPNAGKSTLLNALARRDVAIVSEIAGTTRDSLEAHVELAGLPVTVVDTAGVRESDDVIESEGVRRALARAETADITVLCCDPKCPLDDQMLALLRQADMVILTKCDLYSSTNVLVEQFKKALPEELLPVLPSIICLSAKTGAAVDELLVAMEDRLSVMVPAATHAVITRQRHRDHLQRAIGYLHEYQLHQNEAIELRCEFLRLAAVECGQITGRIDVEELLGVIFSSFCIGK